MYQELILPIHIGNGLLTPECAYFLGAVFSADESFIYNETKYWIAPIRHNFGQDITREILEHQNLLLQIIGRAKGNILTRDELKNKNWFNSSLVARAFTTKQGFAALFESDLNTEIDSIIDTVISAINLSPQEVKQAFMVGAFDGRSALDTNKKTNKIRYLALDCANINTANYLSTLLTEMGIEFNYNTARDRVEGGAPRKAQLRIPGNNIPLFMEKVGIVSPLKFELIRAMQDSNLHEHKNNKILWGLKTLSLLPQIDTVFPLSTEIEKNTQFDLDNCILEDIIDKSEEKESEIQYTGVPKEKTELVTQKGRKTPKRDRSVAINALIIAKHKCEIDQTHATFIRRNSSLPYTEPHHLIPLAYFEMFEVSLDVEENIVSLCSNCHNQMHYGRDVRNLLNQLYSERVELLQKVGIHITFEELCKMYNA